MCKVMEMTIGNRTIHVADIKQKYISNIVDAARKCDLIDQIMLFGSSIDERCTEDSDIDLAIFGSKEKYQAYRSRSYDDFVRQIYEYDLDQNYDLLYFTTGKKRLGGIHDSIEKGELIYARNS